MFLRANRYANISDDHESRLTKYRLVWLKISFLPSFLSRSLLFTHNCHVIINL